MRLRYYSTACDFRLRECRVSDDGESKSSKLARLSFNLLNHDEEWSEWEQLLNAKYPLEGLAEEYSSLQYAY